MNSIVSINWKCWLNVIPQKEKVIRKKCLKRNQNVLRILSPNKKKSKMKFNPSIPFRVTVAVRLTDGSTSDRCNVGYNTGHSLEAQIHWWCWVREYFSIIGCLVQSTWLDSILGSCWSNRGGIRAFVELIAFIWVALGRCSVSHVSSDGIQVSGFELWSYQHGIGWDVCGSPANSWRLRYLHSHFFRREQAEHATQHGVFPDAAISSWLSNTFGQNGLKIK